MILELQKPIPLDTPKGPARAFFVIDDGTEQEIEFVCFVNETGECWCFKQRDVKLERNMTHGVRFEGWKNG